MSDLRPPRQQPLQSEWAKFIAGFGYAFRGLWYVLRTQRNARIHVSIAILAILLGIVLHISAVEFAMVFVAITGVFIAEIFNTNFVTRIHKQKVCYSSRQKFGYLFSMLHKLRKSFLFQILSQYPIDIGITPPCTITH